MLLAGTLAIRFINLLTIWLYVNEDNIVIWYNCIEDNESWILQTIKLEEMEKKAGNAEAQVSHLPQLVDQPTKSCFQSEHLKCFYMFTKVLIGWITNHANWQSNYNDDWEMLTMLNRHNSFFFLRWETSRAEFSSWKRTPWSKNKKSNPKVNNQLNFKVEVNN